jgi:tetratricopeptide (TPR) repeat protein
MLHLSHHHLSLTKRPSNFTKKQYLPHLQSGLVFLVLFSISLFLGGCATKGFVKEEVFNAKSDLDTGLRNTNDEVLILQKQLNDLEAELADLKRENQSLSQKLSSFEGETSRNFSEVRSEQTSLKQQTSRDISNMNNKLDEEAALATQRNEQLQNTLKNAQEILYQETLKILDDMSKTMTRQDGLLGAEIEQVRTDASEMYDQTKLVAGTVRSALHRQREVLQEQYQSINNLTMVFDEIMGETQSAKRPGTAAQFFNEAIIVHKKAISDEDLDQYVKALELYTKGLELRPDYIPAHFNAASILLELDRPQDAVPHLELILEKENQGHYATSSKEVLKQIRNKSS